MGARVRTYNGHITLKTAARVDFQIDYEAIEWCLLFSGYSGLAPPSQSPPVSMLHGKQVMTSGAVSATGSGPVNIPVTGVTGVPGVTGQVPGVVSAQHNKKYRPPHKTEKFTPKPIPPELGNLKTYSKFHLWVVTIKFYSLFWRLPYLVLRRLEQILNCCALIFQRFTTSQLTKHHQTLYCHLMVVVHTD